MDQCKHFFDWAFCAPARASRERLLRDCPPRYCFWVTVGLVTLSALLLIACRTIDEPWVALLVVSALVVAIACLVLAVVARAPGWHLLVHSRVGTLAGFAAIAIVLWIGRILAQGDLNRLFLGGDIERAPALAAGTALWAVWFAAVIATPVVQVTVLTTFIVWAFAHLTRTADTAPAVRERRRRLSTRERISRALRRAWPGWRWVRRRLFLVPVPPGGQRHGALLFAMLMLAFLTTVLLSKQFDATVGLPQTRQVALTQIMVMSSVPESNLCMGVREEEVVFPSQLYRWLGLPDQAPTSRSTFLDTARDRAVRLRAAVSAPRGMQSPRQR